MMSRTRRRLWTAAAATALLIASGAVALTAGTASADQNTALATTAGCGKTPTLRDGTYTIQSGRPVPLVHPAAAG